MANRINPGGPFLVPPPADLLEVVFEDDSWWATGMLLGATPAARTTAAALAVAAALGAVAQFNDEVELQQGAGPTLVAPSGQLARAGIRLLKWDQPDDLPQAPVGTLGLDEEPPLVVPLQLPTANGVIWATSDEGIPASGMEEYYWEPDFRLPPAAQLWQPAPQDEAPSTAVTLVEDDAPAMAQPALARAVLPLERATDEAFPAVVDDDSGQAQGYVARSVPAASAQATDDLPQPPAATLTDEPELSVAYFAQPWPRAALPVALPDELPVQPATLAAEEDAQAPAVALSYRLPYALPADDGSSVPSALDAADEGQLPLLPGFTAYQLPARWAFTFDDAQLPLSTFVLLVEDLRFVAFDYGRPFDVLDLARLFLAGDSARPEAAADAVNRFLAADEARNFVGLDPEPQGAKVSFDVKYTPEIVTLTFPFTGELNGSTITGTPSVTVTTVVGNDGSPSNLLNGAAQVSGGLVLQSVKAGLDGCSYHFVCTATLADSRVLVRTGTLQVKAP